MNIQENKPSTIIKEVSQIKEADHLGLLKKCTMNLRQGEENEKVRESKSDITIKQGGGRGQGRHSN